jgi:hypothetical protein
MGVSLREEQDSPYQVPAPAQEMVPMVEPTTYLFSIVSQSYRLKPLGQDTLRVQEN